VEGDSRKQREEEQDHKKKNSCRERGPYDQQRRYRTNFSPSRLLPVIWQAGRKEKQQGLRALFL
jgi:hypothetical protein